MRPIGFAVRDNAGVVYRNEISADGAPTPIAAGNGQEISLNLRQSDVQGYMRLGDNLQITLADGRVVMLEDFFGGTGADARLFLSTDGYLSEVELVQGADGAVYASYAPAEAWGKWSPSDQLIFLEGTEVAHADIPQDEEVSMLGAGLLGGLGGAGLLAGSAAAVAGASVIGGLGGGGDSGGSGHTRIEPTVDQDGVVTVGGDDVTDADKAIVITGTAEPGSEVVVTIGDKEQTTTATDEGTWGVEFEGENFPGDGEYDVGVVVTEDDGTVTELDGPDLVIDLTGPEITFTDGTVSAGDMTNAEDYADGVEIGGTGEAGASIEVTIGDVTHSTTVGEDGTWGVVFGTGEIAGGEYETQVTVVSRDSYGNSTTVTDTVVIDTVGSVSIDSGLAGGDDVVNAAEQAAGITLTGASQPGSSVQVTMNGVTHAATVDASGNWSVDFAASEVPTGERDVTVSAVATDAHGNVSNTSSTLRIDTVNTATFNSATIESDGIVNAAERADGVTLQGTTQPGSTVEVTMNGVTHMATVDANGNWSADFAAGELPEGELFSAVSVTSTDAAGNVATATGDVRFDTLVNNFTMNGGIGGADGIVNAVEAAGGVAITGQVEPGSGVIVSVGGLSYTATVAANGSWSVHVPSGDLPGGTNSLPITATATDAAGNTRALSGTMELDTVVDNLGFTGGPVATDDVINAAERAAGVPITGTVEPGSTVTVTMNGVTRAATVDASGNWTANFAAGDIATGERDATITVNATDRAGNTDSITRDVRIDTLVNLLQNGTTPVEGDNIVNASEALDGFTLDGTVEPGSSVQVAFNGQSYAATVSAGGHWSVNIPAGAIPVDEAVMNATITATDAAGNTASIARAIEIDTEVPASPTVENYTRGLSGYEAISVDQTVDDLAVYKVDHATGNISQMADDGDGVNFAGNTHFAFGTPAPDGSHLIVTSTDAAGNSSGTYLVLDESSTSVVDMGNANLGNFQIESIDLQFADDSQLTISEAQIKALSTNSDSVVIHGGIDDTVTITGAVKTGSTDIGTQHHDIYTLGDATLIIDDNINVVI